LYSTLKVTTLDVPILTLKQWASYYDHQPYKYLLTRWKCAFVIMLLLLLKVIHQTFFCLLCNHKLALQVPWHQKGVLSIYSGSHKYSDTSKMAISNWRIMFFQWNLDMLKFKSYTCFKWFFKIFKTIFEIFII